MNKLYKKGRPTWTSIVWALTVKQWFLAVNSTVKLTVTRKTWKVIKLLWSEGNDEKQQKPLHRRPLAEFHQQCRTKIFHKLRAKRFNCCYNCFPQSGFLYLKIPTKTCFKGWSWMFYFLPYPCCCYSLCFVRIFRVFQCIIGWTFYTY